MFQDMQLREIPKVPILPFLEPDFHPQRLHKLSHMVFRMPSIKYEWEE